MEISVIFCLLSVVKALQALRLVKNRWLCVMNCSDDFFLRFNACSTAVSRLTFQFTYSR
jgi:hypothetical protein